MLTAIPGFAPDLDYMAGGMLRKVMHANGVDEEIAIHPSTGMARPHKISTTATPAWDTGAYAYDGSGNNEAIGTLTFVYDRLHRLVSGDVEAGGTTKTQTVSYDRMGNVTSLTTGGVLRPTTTALATNHMFDGTYDAAGNLTAIPIDGVGYQYGYDALSMMSTLQSGVDARVFVYDADDERILTLDCNAPNDCEDPATHETRTLRGLGGKVLRVYDRPWSADFTWQRDYAYRNGQPLATIEATPGGGARALQLHLDHLGSVRQVTDAFGVQVALHNYYPFGEEATEASQDEVKLKFTGHERDASDDVDYMHARHYLVAIARFVTVDPARESASQGRSQSWPRYTYVEGNPLTYVDPSGEVISFSYLSADQQSTLLSALTQFTGNTYEIDRDGNLQMMAAGGDGSSIAAAFLSELINSGSAYSVRPTSGRNRFDGGDVLLNFSSFDDADYGKVDPRTFNLGSTLIHELHHASRGSKDQVEGVIKYSYDWTGPAVDFVNTIRAERNLPLRASYIGEPTIFGNKERVRFDHVKERRPNRIYYVKRPRLKHGS